MKTVEEAIEAAYQAHITSLYEVLAQSILAANGDDTKIDAAEDRFKRGLDFAADVRKRARAAAGLP